jgi:S-adenosylmethionine-diacylgycerolhomoserine-N-methlytransferase
MPGDPRAAMDRMYRHQRHIYDLTRKFYLLGRDRVLRELPLEPGDKLCEIGCGTARNLIFLARRHPDVALYGIDASAEMLATAKAAIARAGLSGRITLAQGLAEEFDPAALFGVERIDTVVFAYSLSMIPEWRAAVARAVAGLAPSGRLVIVDFWDQHGLPGWFSRGLRRWLALFGVQPRLDLVAALDGNALGAVAHLPLYGGYAVMASGVKR